jgi:hypothetical protein
MNNSSSSTTNITRNSLDDPNQREVKLSTNNSLTIAGTNIFSSFKRMFTPAMVNISNDRLNRTSTTCITASIPTRAVSQWVCVEFVSLRAFLLLTIDMISFKIVIVGLIT